tara:strand:- start:65 stop:1954 length:1890 start_codon:yes stop_codon:yes gene_type:complete
LYGLASLPFVGAEKAAQNVQDVQGALSYQPKAGTQSAQLVEGFNSPYNPLTWIPRAAAAAGDYAGGALADAGMPMAGAITAGALNAAPMALGFPRVAGAVGRGIGAVADTVRPLPAPLEVSARIEPTMNKPQLVMRNGKIVPKEAVPEGVLPQARGVPQAGGVVSPGGVPQQSIMGDTRGTPAATTVPGRPDLPLSALTPELSKKFQDAAASGQQLNRAAIKQAEAQSMAVPMKLSEGQATGNVVKISDELNTRAALGARLSAEDLNAQAKALAGTLDVVRKKAAPDVTGDNPMMHGQSLIDSYKAVDAPRLADIDVKYQALRDANGGEFPVDGKALHDNVMGVLKKELLTDDAPKGQMNALKEIADGGGSMTMEQYLAMRKRLGTVARTSQDGNARAAASVMIDELEKLPLQGGAAALKPLADAARTAARDRHDLLKADPAYAAAVGDDVPMLQSSPLADKFVERYVIPAPRAHLLRMQENLASDPLAKQTISAAAIDALRTKARADSEVGKFASDSYHGIYSRLSPKADALFDPYTATQLHLVDSASAAHSLRPTGNFVNTSNNLVAAAGTAGKAILRGTLAVKSGGASEVGIAAVDKITRPFREARARAKTMSPTAGVGKLDDVGK